MNRKAESDIRRKIKVLDYAIVGRNNVTIMVSKP